MDNYLKINLCGDMDEENVILMSVGGCHDSSRFGHDRAEVLINKCCDILE